MSLKHSIYAQIGKYGASIVVIIMLAFAPLTPALTPQKAHAECALTGKALSAIGSVVQDFIGSTISDFLGGSVLGSVFGAVGLGGAEVPVNDASVRSNTGTLVTKECILDGILWGVVNILLSSAINAITAWVEDGFEGGPAFITDLEGFLLSTANEAAGEFISGGPLGFLCSPFRLDVQIALITEYFTPRHQRELECTLTGALANTENFMRLTRGEFSAGGLSEWFEFVTQPQNNPIGGLATAELEGGIYIRNAQGQEITVRNWGDGFNSKECTDDEGESYICTPGSVIQNEVAEWVGVPRERLTIADEIDELLSALIGVFLDNITANLNNLLGFSQTEAYQSESNRLSSSAQSFKEELLAQIDETIAEETAAGNTEFIDELQDLRSRVAAVPAGNPQALTRLYQLQQEYVAIVNNTSAGDSPEGSGANGPEPPPPGSPGVGGTNPPSSSPGGSGGSEDDAPAPPEDPEDTP